MVQGIGKGGAAAMAATEGTQAVNSALNTGGASELGGHISQQVDAKEAATAPKFGDIYKQIQAKYGEKAEKPREIKKTLGKDDFLKIMLTQMKNQDPTNPFKAEQMATEMAQFTSVEQLQNVNQNLNKMSTQNKPIEQMAMTNMIGKAVTIDRDRFSHIEGQNDALSINLPRNAATVHIALVSDLGESVFERDLGPQKSGEVSFTWDGKKSNTLPAKAGTYMLRIDAKDERGQNIETNPQARAHVIGVTFEGAEPLLLVGDARHQEKITMKNIVRIEMDSGQLPSDKGMSPITPVAPQKSQNFIQFEKGVGSKNLSPEDLARSNPQIAKALEKLQDTGTSPSAINPEEKGFPSGLQDPEQQKPMPMPPARQEMPAAAGRIDPRQSKEIPLTELTKRGGR